MIDLEGNYKVDQLTIIGVHPIDAEEAIFTQEMLDDKLAVSSFSSSFSRFITSERN